MGLRHMLVTGVFAISFMVCLRLLYARGGYLISEILESRPR